MAEVKEWKEKFEAIVRRLRLFNLRYDDLIEIEEEFFRAANTSKRLMITRGGDIHEECPDCRGECTPYSPVASHAPATAPEVTLEQAREWRQVNWYDKVPEQLDVALMSFANSVIDPEADSPAPSAPATGSSNDWSECPRCFDGKYNGRTCSICWGTGRVTEELLNHPIIPDGEAAPATGKELCPTCKCDPVYLCHHPCEDRWHDEHPTATQSGASAAPEQQTCPDCGGTIGQRYYVRTKPTPADEPYTDDNSKKCENLFHEQSGEVVGASAMQGDEATKFALKTYGQNLDNWPAWSVIAEAYAAREVERLKAERARQKERADIDHRQFNLAWNRAERAERTVSELRARMAQAEKVSEEGDDIDAAELRKLREEKKALLHALVCPLDLCEECKPADEILKAAQAEAVALKTDEVK